MTSLRIAALQALEQLKINRTNFRKGPSKSICKMLAGGNDEVIADLESALAEPDEPDEPTYCPTCGEEDGGTTCGMPDCGLRCGAEPVQEPFCYVYEYDSPYGLHREFYPREYNGMKPSRTVPLYTAPPIHKSLSITDLQEALVYTCIIDRDAIDDPDEYDEGSTLAQIDELHRIIQRHIES